MEKETGYIEKIVKSISADKNRMFSLIFSAISALCTILYVTTVGTSGIHFVFILAMLLSAVTNILYVIDVESKIKHADNIVVCGISLMLLGLILKVARVGIAFSIVYFIGYLVYAFTFLLLGLYCTKNDAKPKVIKILLIICTAWSLFEFFSLSSSFLVGITWKIFRLSEAFLCAGYFFLLNLIEKTEVPFFEKIGEYKKQVPSLKLCISILLILAIVFATIGFVIDMGNRTTTTVVNQKTTTQEPATTKKPKKSTVTSTVVPAETEPKPIEEIKIGDMVETDSFTFKLNKVEITRRVQPDNPPSYYTYYQAEAEHTYIYVNASVTNKEKFSLECDEIYSVTADYDGGYQYNGFNIADDNDGDFTYANITSIEPLETLGVHCLIDCPQLIEEEGKSLFITIKLTNGSKYKYIIKQ